MEKKTRQKGDMGFLIALGLFSLLCLLASAKLFFRAPKLSGEGTIPLLCSLVMMVTSCLLIAERKGYPQPFADRLPLVRKAKETFVFLFPGKVGVIVLYCVLYAIMLPLVGFAVSTFGFLVLSMLTLHHEKRVRSLVISAVTMLCILVIFQYLFQVQLP